MKKILFIIVLAITSLMLIGCDSEEEITYGVEAEIVYIEQIKTVTRGTITSRERYRTTFVVKYNDKEFTYDRAGILDYKVGDMVTVYVSEEDMIPREQLNLLGDEDVFLVTIKDRRTVTDGWEYKISLYNDTEIIDYWYPSELLFSVDELVLAIEYNDNVVILYDFDN